MNKKITTMIMVMFLIPLSYADTQVEMVVDSEDSINATIVQFSNQSINTDLVCVGPSCTTNVYGGSINVPDNQTFNYNDYSSYTQNVKGGSGMSLSDLIGSVGKYVNDFIKGDGPNYEPVGWVFLDMLSHVFVKKTEFMPVKNNMMYMSEQIDRLKAENEMLKSLLGVELNEADLECQTMLNYAKRTGTPQMKLKDGRYIDLTLSTTECIGLQKIA